MAEPSGRDPVVTFFGVALMAVGGLIALLCGLCAVWVVVGGLVDILGTPRQIPRVLLLSGLPAAAILGGLPTVVGILIFRWGRGLYRPRARDA
jgi:hypothetical protein